MPLRQEGLICERLGGFWVSSCVSEFSSMMEMCNDEENDYEKNHLSKEVSLSLPFDQKKSSFNARLKTRVLVSVNFVF